MIVVHLGFIQVLITPIDLNRVATNRTPAMLTFIKGVYEANRHPVFVLQVSCPVAGREANPIS